MTTSHPLHDTAEQLTLLPVSELPVQFRLDQRTRARGLAHIAAIRRQLAAKGTPTEIAPERGAQSDGRRHEAA